MRKFFDKIFGGLKMSWLTVIVMAVVLGVWTALMALLVPDGNSFHDIAVTPEWWVLPAIIIIVNCKKPLEAALKVFVFFLISQPLVYLIQVPFNSMGWGLFGYYPYWFKITLATLPAGFIGWYVKKDEWYSGVILSFMTVLLAYTGVGYISHWGENFPNHLISVIYCFSMIPIFVYGIFKKWQPRVVTLVITVVFVTICTIAWNLIKGNEYDVQNASFITESGIEVVGEPMVTAWGGSNKGNVEYVGVQEDGTYLFNINGVSGGEYWFEITDEAGNEYGFTYSWDDGSQSVVVKRAE